LIKDFYSKKLDGEKYKEYENNEVLKNTFYSILSEYNEMTQNKKVIKSYKSQLRFDLIYLEYELCKSNLELYEATRDLEFLELLNDFNWGFDRTKNINEQLKKFITKLKRLKMKVQILKIKHEKKFEQNNHSSLDSRALSLERILNLSYNIDVKKTSVERWVNINELAKQVIADRRNG